MFLTKKILCILFFWSTISLIAQNNLTEAENNYTPNQGSIFNSSNKQNINSSSSVDIDLISSLKFCPTAILRQKALFFLEWDAYGIDVPVNFGFGAAFGDDWLQNIYFNQFNRLSFNKLPDGALSPAELIRNSKFQSGYLLHGGLKIYFSGNAFDGVYMELFYSFENMNYVVNDDINGIPVENIYASRLKHSYSINSGGIAIGYGTARGENIMCTHDFFIRFNARFFTFDKYVLNTTSSFNPQLEYRRSGKIDQRVIPSIDIGYAIGIGW